MKGRNHARAVIDVSTEQPCPARPGTLPHKIEATHLHRGNPNGRDPVWACVHCHVPWADLDAAVRPERGEVTTPRVTIDKRTRPDPDGPPYRMHPTSGLVHGLDCRWAWEWMPAWTGQAASTPCRRCLPDGLPERNER